MLLMKIAKTSSQLALMPPRRNTRPHHLAVKKAGQSYPTQRTQSVVSTPGFHWITCHYLVNTNKLSHFINVIVARAISKVKAKCKVVTCSNKKRTEHEGKTKASDSNTGDQGKSKFSENAVIFIRYDSSFAHTCSMHHCSWRKQHWSKRPYRRALLSPRPQGA